MSLKILAEENRGVLLDIVVFFLNLWLMQWLTRYVVELFRLADTGEPLAQFALRWHAWRCGSFPQPAQC